MLLVWAIVLRSRAHPLTRWGAGRVVVTLLAAALLSWTVYLRLGRDLVDRALREHRGGDAERALALYQQAERTYPFAWDDFVVQARQGARECARFLVAEAAHRQGAHQTAVGVYEALLVGSPAISLQEQASEHLLASLYAWAMALEGAGEWERALDRYRFIRDDYRDRAVHQAMTDLYLAWGKVLEEEGDHQAAIAVYRRISQEVADPRLWSSADAPIVDAYCAWSAAVHAAGEPEWAAALCNEVSDAFASLAGERCPRCSQ
jgi:tetratricopeptide (TPR) repeat protein